MDIGSRAITVAGLQLVNASVSGYGGTLTSLGDCNFQGNGSVNTTLVCNGGMTVSGTGTFYMWYKPTVAGLFTLQSGGLNWQGSSFANADYVLNGGQMSVFVEAGTYPIKSLVLNGAGISVFYPDSTTLVSSSTYDIRSGTIDIALGGSVGADEKRERFGRRQSSIDLYGNDDGSGRVFGIQGEHGADG